VVLLSVTEYFNGINSILTLLSVSNLSHFHLSFSVSVKLLIFSGLITCRQDSSFPIYSSTLQYWHTENVNSSVAYLTFLHHLNFQLSPHKIIG